MTSELKFINTFGAGVSQQFINCVVSAENALSAQFTNSITLRLTFNEQALGTNVGFVAQNDWPSTVPVTYSQLKAVLPTSDALPSIDPTGGHIFSLPEAYARMLGLSSSAPATDDTITLNTSYNWSFGQDVINALQHEITEGGMGRVGGLGDQNGEWSTMDLFRFSAPGVRDFTDGRDGKTTYFSSNGSSLSTLSFNNEYTSNGIKNNSGDTGDFTQNDVFGTTATGETNTLSQTDIAVMKALGWSSAATSVAPVVNVQNVTLAANTSIAASTMITSISNPSGDSITSYAFWDGGGGTGHFAVNGVTQPDAQWITVSASNLSNVIYVGGSVAGSESLFVEVFDATTNSWSNFSTLIATTTASSNNTSNIFSGPSNHYTVSTTAGASTISVQDKVGSDGARILTNPQSVQFSDGLTIDTTTFDKTAALLPSQLNELVDLYVAYFNRAADAVGLDYWGGKLFDGMSFATMSGFFSSSAEAAAAYPSTLSNQTFVTTVYNNVLDRAPDATGSAYWAGLLNSGAVTKGNFILSVIQSVLLQNGTADAALIAAKESVSAHFALTQGLNDNTEAKAVMALVQPGTVNTTSISSANALTDSYAASAATAAGSELVVKILGIVS